METSDDESAIAVKTESTPGQGVISWEDLFNNLQPDHTSFFVNMGEPYYGVYFTLDPAIVKFSESDCLNILVKETSGDDLRELDLGKLQEVFTKCPNVENLKFFGVKIDGNLLEVVSKGCPKLKNLELNLQETPTMVQERFVLDFLVDVRFLVPRCSKLEHIIIRRPSRRILAFFDQHPDFGHDCVDRNYLFVNNETSDYHVTSFRHHNVNHVHGAGTPCINSFV